MARMLSQTLLRRATVQHPYSLKYPPLIPLCFYCHRSSKAQLIEIDLDSSSSSSPSSSSSDGGREGELLAIKKLDDMIRRSIVHKSTPYWLPFVPGSSFWVPPQRESAKIIALVDKWSNQLTEEESLSFSTLRGWPCSSFLIQDSASTHPVEVGLEFSVTKEEGVEVKVEVLTSLENVSEPEDEEE